jgi:tetratricopeptide (TPR) repeat protein
VSAKAVLELIDEALPVFIGAGDDYALARATHMRAIVEVGLQLRCAGGAVSAREANERYRTAGVPRSCDVLLAQSALMGPVPVSQAIEDCRRISVDRTTQRFVLPYLECVEANLEALQERFDVARALIRRAESSHREYGQLGALATVWTTSAAAVERLAGNHAYAEQLLAQACDELRTTDNRSWYATHTAHRAAAAVGRGDVDEATALTEESAANAPIDDLLPQVLWRQARALCLAARGAVEEAEQLARAAITLLAGADALALRADALVTLATVVGASGNASEAEEALETARELYDKKGAFAEARRVLALRHGLQVG